MKILHTSDWHLGRTLCGRKRHAEFEAFLDWLVETIQSEQVDVLLVAGDVFDTTMPGNTAQTLYYRFLCRVAASCCRHVIVIAGNHDSPAFLNAPRELLKALDVHIVSSITEDPEDEVLILNDVMNKPELIVCAVPYLRDRDIRVVDAGEGVEDKERKLLSGIRSHYVAVCELAEKKRIESGSVVPVVVMGHLFTAGGETVEGDGVRELYVGSLAHVSAGIFPDSLDYLALGHLHVPQQIGSSQVMRYSGSPLPMGFGEAGQQKSVVVVEFEQFNTAVTDSAKSSVLPATSRPQAVVRLISIPVFQQLERIKGDLSSILNRINALVNRDVHVWLEIIYEGETVQSDLRTCLDDAIAGSKVEILRVRNNRIIDRALNSADNVETLGDLDIDDVFVRCLAAHEIPDAQQSELIRAYHEIVMSLSENEPDTDLQ
ncbi:Exodeoxyribonuclease I subunit D [Nitrosomonas marina]|uniref:Nuclease SbcCD subunit D n=1 Tax=Nitrosomonas marina TaxID=917 RepID=A0A1I0FSD3_9PROT|nr:exonuclease SbcCD subunit D C-terminal domain-containing protein [Nitrosomonas marina]SET60285.1 Exodeoxyribonuclease I subunit D [Nitrosomonas marina]